MEIIEVISDVLVDCYFKVFEHLKMRVCISLDLQMCLSVTDLFIFDEYLLHEMWIPLKTFLLMSLFLMPCISGFY